MRFGPALMSRLDALGAITEVPGQLTRRYLSPAHIESMRQTEAWMVEAGMSVRTDPLLSLFGRYEGRTPGRPAIMIGSHLDTVVDAGRYDGGLGVLAAIAVVAELSRTGERLDHAVEVAAFGEEEGSRFPTHILTSSALIGAVKPALLDAKDAVGHHRARGPRRGRRRRQGLSRLRAQQGRDRRLSGAAHRAGAGAGGQGPGARRRHRHQRLRALARDRDGLCRPRRHRADGRRAAMR